MRNKLIIPVFLMIFLIICVTPQVFGGTWTGDFEIGNFSRWDGVGASWSISSDVVHSGTYSAKCVWSSFDVMWIRKAFEGDVNNVTTFTFFVYFEDLDYTGKMEYLTIMYNKDSGIGTYPVKVEVQELDGPYKWWVHGITYDSGWQSWGVGAGEVVLEGQWYNVTIVSNRGAGSEDTKVYIDNLIIADGPTIAGTMKLIDAFAIDGRVSGGSTVFYVDDITFTSEPMEDDKYEPPEPWEFDWSWLKWLLALIVLIIIVSFALYVKYGDNYYGF